MYGTSGSPSTGSVAELPDGPPSAPRAVEAETSSTDAAAGSERSRRLALLRVGRARMPHDLTGHDAARLRSVASSRSMSVSVVR